MKNENSQILVVAAKIESEIAEFETYEERKMFLQEIGLEESGVSRLIKSAYQLLNLQTFLTAGVQEARAWTFQKDGKLLNVLVLYILILKRFYSCRSN